MVKGDDVSNEVKVKFVMLSILTPTLGRHTCLYDIYDSLCGHHNSSIEWIVANDGRCQDVENVVKELAQISNFEITYCYSSIRVGKAVLDNILIQNASGDYLVWCDSGDYFTSDSIRKFLEFFSGCEPDVFGIIGLCNDQSGSLQTHFPYGVPAEGLYTYSEISELITGDSTICTRSKEVRNLRFPEVDFVVTESALWRNFYWDKKFYVSHCIFKVMERDFCESISFGNKMKYVKGMLIGIACAESKHVFDSKSIGKKVKKIIAFFRYASLCKYDKSEIKLLWPLLKERPIYMSLRYLGFLLAYIDKLFNRYEATHIEFENNLASAEIIISKL